MDFRIYTEPPRRAEPADRVCRCPTQAEPAGSGPDVSGHLHQGLGARAPATDWRRLGQGLLAERLVRLGSDVDPAIAELHSQALVGGN